MISCRLRNIVSTASTTSFFPHLKADLLPSTAPLPTQSQCDGNKDERLKLSVSL